MTFAGGRSAAGRGSAELERIEGRDDLVSRALRNKSLWLTLAYVGAILLMARAYA